jgi:hypothetical protein
MAMAMTTAGLAATTGSQQRARRPRHRRVRQGGVGACDTRVFRQACLGMLSGQWCQAGWRQIRQAALLGCCIMPRTPAAPRSPISSQALTCRGTGICRQGASTWQHAGRQARAGSSCQVRLGLSFCCPRHPCAPITHGHVTPRCRNPPPCPRRRGMLRDVFSDVPAPPPVASGAAPSAAAAPFKPVVPAAPAPQVRSQPSIGLLAAWHDDHAASSRATCHVLPPSRSPVCPAPSPSCAASTVTSRRHPAHSSPPPAPAPAPPALLQATGVPAGAGRPLMEGFRFESQALKYPGAALQSEQ